MLSEPVALVISMFLRYFSTFSCEIHGIEKSVFAGIFLSQNSFSLSKLDAKGGSLIFDATETKYLLNWSAISFGFSMLLLSTFNENIPQLSLHLLAPISLNDFQTLAGLLAFSFKISEYWCFLDCFIREHTLLRQILYCSLSFIDLYLSLVFIASIISPLSHFGCCLRLTRCCFKGKCLSIMSKNKEDQLSTISLLSGLSLAQNLL